MNKASFEFEGDHITIGLDGGRKVGTFDEFRKIPEGKKISRPEALMAYERSYMELLKRYKNEIQEIEGMMRTLREERCRFYEEQLPAIQKEMKQDGVSCEIGCEWLAELRTNVEKSFQISEKLIEHYVTKNLEEFKEALRQEMKVV